MARTSREPRHYGSRQNTPSISPTPQPPPPHRPHATSSDLPPEPLPTLDLKSLQVHTLRRALLVAGRTQRNARYLRHTLRILWLQCATVLPQDATAVRLNSPLGTFTLRKVHDQTLFGQTVTDYHLTNESPS
jgi:hypothetical protein